MQDMLKDGLISAFDMDTEKYVEHSKAFKLFVTEHNDSVEISSIIESKDAIFDENRFSSVPRPSLKIPNKTEDIGGLVVPEEVTEEVLADLPLGCKPLGCKWIFNRKLKVNGTIEKFKASTIRLLIAIASIHNLIINQMDVKTSFLNGNMEEHLSNVIKSLMKWFYLMVIYLTKLTNAYIENLIKLVDLTKEFLTSKFSMKDMGEADVILCIRIKHKSNRIAISRSLYIEKVLKIFNYFDCTLVSTPMDTSEKLMPNNGQAVSQLEYFKVISCLIYVMTFTRPDIAFVVGKLSRYTSNSSTQQWQTIQRAFKKQTFITGSIIEYEFVALAAASKEAEWLKNLLPEIPLWSKPITPISIRCDSAATLAKAYSQMYNGKSRHLGVRHSMIRKLITNGVIDF
uniref:Zinc finger, CCHC-type n=1 Tax=Tanacetum cinerariifolium TaxID=118510 RepID=A0A6L2KJ57_TANCI|nr:zinc finger, CCHC-type [Tanacetum cinerariifolium]